MADVRCGFDVNLLRRDGDGFEALAERGFVFWEVFLGGVEIEYEHLPFVSGEKEHVVDVGIDGV